MEPCCEDITNRTPVEKLDNGLTFQRCGKCQRRHFELVLNKGVLGTSGANL